jgi:hypothetical protein
MGNASLSQLRVFLSADLVGSTKLKNRLNHQELLGKYKSRHHVVEKLRAADSRLEISDDIERRALLESLGVSTDDFDWAIVVCNFYQGIHASFVSALREGKPDGIKSEDLDGPFRPWKAVGDELIYEIPVSGRKSLHLIAIAFLKAIRENDRKVAQRKDDSITGLRIKGAAWVAGFPVRNRKIDLPPDNRPDYLGPDMDAGFRIGRCTRAGMLVVSADMAELLGECQGQYAPMLAKVVGWEELKGVWNDQRYPVIWVDFPDSHPASDTHKAQRFTVWDQEDCRWCKSWEQTEAKRQLSDISRTLREIRSGLPKSLGLVDPYIIGDELETSQIDGDHLQILELLGYIEEHKSDVIRQDATSGVTADSQLQHRKQQVQELVRKSTIGNASDDSQSRPADG